MDQQANPISPTSPRLELGQLCATPGAQEVLQRYQVNPLLLLGRHLAGDYGDLSTEDARANDEALKVGARLLSAYQLPLPGSDSGALPPVKVWIITEADRSVTTILLPEEY